MTFQAEDRFSLYHIKKALPKLGSAFQRMKGVEPSSSAWKAEIISRYMTSAKVVFTILILWIIVKRVYVKRGKK